MSGQGNPVLQARITVLEKAVTPLTARITVLEEKEAARQREKEEKKARNPPASPNPPDSDIGFSDILFPREYDNSVTYAKCDKVAQNNVAWQMIYARGEPGYSPPTDGSESNNHWAKIRSPEARDACPQAGGRRASRRRHPKKKATRRR